MNSQFSDKIIKSLAFKYGLPELVIRKIVLYQFQFVKEKMADGTKGDYETFPTIKLPDFGTFTPMKGKINRMGDGSEYERKKREIFKKKYGEDLDEVTRLRQNKDDDEPIRDEPQ